MNFWKHCYGHKHPIPNYKLINQTMIKYIIFSNTHVFYKWFYFVIFMCKCVSYFFSNSVLKHILIKAPKNIIYYLIKKVLQIKTVYFLPKNV